MQITCGFFLEQDTLRHMLHMKFGFDWPSGFRGEEIVNDGRRNDGRRTDDGAWVYYKLTCEPSAQVS